MWTRINFPVANGCIRNSYASSSADGRSSSDQWEISYVKLRKSVLSLMMFVSRCAWISELFQLPGMYTAVSDRWGKVEIDNWERIDRERRGRVRSAYPVPSNQSHSHFFQKLRRRRTHERPSQRGVCCSSLKTWSFFARTRWPVSTKFHVYMIYWSFVYGGEQYNLKMYHHANQPDISSGSRSIPVSPPEPDTHPVWCLPCV